MPADDVYFWVGQHRMRIFYVPWVMICGVWGWLAADPVFAKPEVSVIEWLLALVFRSQSHVNARAGRPCE
jgi:hypothetical protein